MVMKTNKMVMDMDNAFVAAIGTERTRTTNGMESFVSTMDANVDLFYSIGASRGKDIIPAFVKAFVEEKELALRIAQWSRDVRGGAGERQLFRNILLYLEKSDVGACAQLLFKVPEIGRWDDVLVITHPALRQGVFDMIHNALLAGDGLCAKWMPRKGPDAIALRNYMKMSPKQYRKTLVSLTKVVETQMCAKDWHNIDFSKLPSLASARYKNAFTRNAPAEYAKWAEGLASGETKVNAGAVFPYDVIKGWRFCTDAQRKNIIGQWEALPDYCDGNNILPMVDVSGSMSVNIHGSSTTAMDVSVSLGVYLADKNKGAFKDTFLTFSGRPLLQTLRGDVMQKLEQMQTAHWEMNTDLMKGFRCILEHAIKNKVPQKDMPTHVFILSDMQFDQCTTYGGTALESIKKHYAEAGYQVPKVIFWNIMDYGDKPARANDEGVALVSGFSPAVMKAVLKNPESITPKQVMLDAVMIPRYDLPFNTNA